MFGAKLVSRAFFRTEGEWIGGRPKSWESVKLVILLNHTSLYEPLLLSKVPNSLIWEMANRVVAPGADKTLSRPLVGLLFKAIVPNMVSISRKRDNTWAEFMEKVSPHSIVAMAPEGRMKRENGLDSEGKPMSIRGGIADVLNAIPDGKMIILYSGGLHHVQVPGQRIPKLFQTIKVNFQCIDTKDYKKKLEDRAAEVGGSFKKALIADLTEKMRQHCPK
jgi:hypothetical protein